MPEEPLQPTTNPETPQQPVTPAAPTSPEPVMPAEPVPQNSAGAAYMQPAPMSQAQPSMPPMGTQKSSPLKSKRILLAGIVGGALLLIGGGAYGYLGVYTQTPDYLWKQGVKNTGNGLKQFIEKPMTTQKGGKIDGSFKVTNPTAIDGTISGSFDKKNTKLNASVGASGIRANLELRGITESTASSPDLYVKVDGLKSVSALLGGASEISTIINQVEDKWFVIDHTLIDQAAAQAQADEKTPNSEEIQKEALELGKKMTVILNERLFTVDDSKAVVVVKEKLAKEDFMGRKAQHLKVQVRKDQLREMVVAMKDATKESKVSTWLMAGESGKSFEEFLEFDDLLKSIDGANYDKAVADVWVDTSLRYIRNVRISNEEDGVKTDIDFMLDYKGGEDLPLSMTITSKDSGAKNDGAIKLGILVNQKSDDIKLTADVNGTFDGQKVAGNAELKVVPTNDAVSVDKPTGATNIIELIGNIMGQSGFDSLGSPSGLGAGITNLLDDFQANESL